MNNSCSYAFRRKIMEYCCPNIEELVVFALESTENLSIKNHLMACEICNDLVGGINEFKKEKKNLTTEAFYTQLSHMDEVYLNTLKFSAPPHDLIDEIAQKLELPEMIKKRIRRIL